MQKKIYVGGLPWELDRIGLLNVFKLILEANEIPASYELPFVTSPLIDANAVIRVVDVFVALDRQTGKSRGFGFVTLDFSEAETADELFGRIVDLTNGKVLIGIRGPRELIVKEADPKKEGEDAPILASAAEGNEGGQPRAEEGAGLDW